MSFHKSLRDLWVTSDLWLPPILRNDRKHPEFRILSVIAIFSSLLSGTRSSVAWSEILVRVSRLHPAQKQLFGVVRGQAQGHVLFLKSALTSGFVFSFKDEKVWLVILECLGREAELADQPPCHVRAFATGKKESTGSRGLASTSLLILSPEDCFERYLAGKGRTGSNRKRPSRLSLHWVGLPSAP